jgi:DNA-binding Lrp family transcriptional regulator
MAKSKKVISKNDKKILDALVENSRQSMLEISEKTGLSRQTVQKILQKLEKDHVIWGYQPIVDEQKNGLKEYFILIKRNTKPLDEKLVDKVISRKLEEMATNYGIKSGTTIYTNGIYDMIVYFLAPDILLAKKYTEFIKTMYTDYIIDVQLLESLFIIRKQGILNPNVANLNQFL